MLLVEAFFAPPNFERNAIGLFDRNIRVEGWSERERYWTSLILDGEGSSTRGVGVHVSVVLDLHILQSDIFCEGLRWRQLVKGIGALLQVSDSGLWGASLLLLRLL